MEATSGFVWPENAFTRDTEDLRRVGSVDELIRERQAGIRSSVLNEENVRTWFANDPEFSRLLDLAQNGVRVDVDPIFQKRSTPPPFRNLRLRLGKVWPAYACEVWQQGLAVLLEDSQMGEDTRALADYMLRIRCTDVDAARAACEPQFAGLFSRWKYLGKTKEADGSKVLEYSVAPLETVTAGVIKELLRGAPGQLVQAVELRQ